MVDLSAVTFFAAAGVHALEHARGTQTAGDELTIVTASVRVIRVLEVCRMTYPRHTQLEQALAACTPSR